MAKVNGGSLDADSELSSGNVHGDSHPNIDSSWNIAENLDSSWNIAENLPEEIQVQSY